MTQEELVTRLHEVGIIPVIAIDRVEDALPLAKALKEGGLPAAEVTFRTDAAAESIAKIRAEYPDMLTIAGTVLTTEQVDRAVSAGAQAIVAPGFNEEVVKYCIEKEIPVMPGVATPSEMEKAMSYGIYDLKFFPAIAAGGLSYIKAVCGPYRKLRFMPTGGINPQNVTEFLSYDKIICCGGTWMVKGSDIAEGNFDKIKTLAKEAAEIVAKVRG